MVGERRGRVGFDKRDVDKREIFCWRKAQRDETFPAYISKGVTKHMRSWIMKTYLL